MDLTVPVADADILAAALNWLLSESHRRSNADARPPISLFSVGRDLIKSIMRTTKVTSLSLPPKLLREAERLARREGRTKSELLREALRRYLADSRWRELQEFGRSQSRKLGIKEPDVERLLQEYRTER
jgi:CopG family transcriptional regulator/antitoxin EndoAI